MSDTTNPTAGDVLVLTEWGERHLVTTSAMARHGQRYGSIGLRADGQGGAFWGLYASNNEMVGHMPLPATAEQAANALRIIVTGADQ